MHLSCWTALFPYLSWQLACRLIAALGFTHVDLAARPVAYAGDLPWDGLDLEPLVQRPEDCARELPAQLSGLLPSALALTPPSRWLDQAEAAEAELGLLARFCRCAGIPVLALAASDLFGPGDWETGLARLRRWHNTVGAEGVHLAIEPNYGAAVRTPADALRMITEVPGLGLVVDPAHQVMQGFRQEELDPLWRHARHVHARQARPGYLQARLQGGTIDFDAVIVSLRAVGYDGGICVENVLLPDAAWLPSDFLDPVGETVALQRLLQGLM